jgi:phosphate transport system substrate-binding protein
VSEDEIAVISRERGSGTRMVFEHAVMAGDRPLVPDCAPSLDDTAPPMPACERDPVASTAVVMYGSEAVVDYVADHPGAIGYLSYGYLRALPEEVVRAIRIEDMPPTPEHVADGRYRLARPFTLVAPEEPTGAVRLFVDFCLGPEGQAMVAEHHVPVRGGG